MIIFVTKFVKELCVLKWGKNTKLIKKNWIKKKLDILTVFVLLVFSLQNYGTSCKMMSLGYWFWILKWILRKTNRGKTDEKFALIDHLSKQHST